MPSRLALALELLAAAMLIALGVRALVNRGRRAASMSRPMAIGSIHGLAGSAVVALLVLGSTTGALAGSVYLLSFSIGTMIGMMLITSLLAVPGRVRWGAGRADAAERYLRFAAGIASLAIGLALAHRVVVGDRLFASTPELSPTSHP